METSKTISDFHASLKVWLNKLGKVGLFFLSGLIGYLFCEIYHFTKSSRSETVVQTMKETSIAVNERGELLLINRKSGDFTIYQDSVGLSIFNHYAKEIQAEFKNQN